MISNIATATSLLESMLDITLRAKIEVKENSKCRLKIGHSFIDTDLTLDELLPVLQHAAAAELLLKIRAAARANGGSS